jgi:hypothetical protein
VAGSDACRRDDLHGPRGLELSVALAVGSEGGAARIWSSGLPAQAVLTARTRKPASAQLNWTPSKNQIGTHAFVFAAASERGSIATQPRTIFVQVVPATPPGIADEIPIGTNGIYRWAYVYRPAAARSRPAMSARVITRLNVYTLDSTVNLVLLVGQKLDRNGRLWYRVRLPILPSNLTGWVSRRRPHDHALGLDVPRHLPEAVHRDALP